MGDIKNTGSDVLLGVTLDKILKPFHEQIGEIAKDAIVAEIDAQSLIDTGRFRASIQAFSDVSDENNMVAGAQSVDCEDERGVKYPVFLEYGTRKMEPRAPFRKSIARVERALKK